MVKPIPDICTCVSRKTLSKHRGTRQFLQASDFVAVDTLSAKSSDGVPLLRLVSGGCEGEVLLIIHLFAPGGNAIYRAPELRPPGLSRIGRHDHPLPELVRHGSVRRCTGLTRIAPSGAQEDRAVRPRPRQYQGNASVLEQRIGVSLGCNGGLGPHPPDGEGYREEVKLLFDAGTTRNTWRLSIEAIGNGALAARI